MGKNTCFNLKPNICQRQERGKMDLQTKETFLMAWKKYFSDSELPITCFYTDELNGVEFPNAPEPTAKGFTCIFSQIDPVRKGRSSAFNIHNLGCFGSFLPFGFNIRISEDVKNYICNIERVKKSYQHVDSTYTHRPPKQAPAKYIIFKRWDTLEEVDNPQVVFFLGNPDVIAGLHGLANYDCMTPHGLIAPSGTGCDSIVGYPMLELESDQPKAVLGALDPSVRIRFKSDTFAFSAPWPKFLEMLKNMDNCFLATESWEKVKSRIN